MGQSITFDDVFLDASGVTVDSAGTTLEAKLPVKLERSDMAVHQVTTGKITVAKNGASSGTADVSRTGYTPLGIVGFYTGNGSDGGGASYASCVAYRLDGTTATITIRSLNTSDTINVYTTFYILYLKNS